MEECNTFVHPFSFCENLRFNLRKSARKKSNTGLMII